MRLFVAADLPADLRARLAGLQGRLGALPLPVRWVRPEGIHLTFKFLGEVGADRLRIGRGATVGDDTVVFYGADVGDGARVAPNGVVMKRDVLPGGGVYEGCPTARR